MRAKIGYNRNCLSINESVLELCVLYFEIRIMFLVISQMFNTTPFICYDDQFIYHTIDELSREQIVHYTFTFRNNYYLLSMFLNKFEWTEYYSAARLLNVFLLFIIILQLRQLLNILCIDRSATKSILLVIALSPYFVIYSVVQLREIICLWGMITLFSMFLQYEKTHRLRNIRIIIVSIILYTTRTYVLEAVLLVFALYKLRNGKWYYKVAICIAALIVVLLFSSNVDYMYVLNNKYEHYVMAGNGATGLLSKLSINGPLDLYKLFFLIPYEQISPLPGTYETYYTSNSWAAWITFVSGISSFFLPYFWLEVANTIKKRKILDYEYRLLLLLVYFLFIIIIASTQPGNSRFMFFVTPIYYIFSIIGMQRLCKKKSKNLIVGLIFACIPYLYLLIK